jgi:hypothetical protein
MVMLYGPPRLGSHTVELLNRESQFAHVCQSKVFGASVRHNNLHLREVAPGNNAMKDYRRFAVVKSKLIKDLQCLLLDPFLKDVEFCYNSIIGNGRIVLL